MHAVIHLAEDVRKYGPLDNISAFPFESFLGRLKKLVRKPSRPLEQVVCRLSEMPEVVKKLMLKFIHMLKIRHTDRPVPRSFTESVQYKRFKIFGELNGV